MKKMIVLLALALSALATQAFAAAVDLSVLNAFHQSNKVNITAEKNSSVDAWAAISAHQAGDKEYWTSSAFGGIAFKTVTPGSSNGTAAPTAPSTSTDSTVDTSYTTM
jgi:hypothetical protein